MKTIPCHLLTVLFLNVNKINKIVVNAIKAKSIKLGFVATSNGLCITLLIIADELKINKTLKIFEPTTLATAMSFSPFLAATIEVTSSGKLVPIATIVNPIIKESTLKNSAICFALSTTTLPPPIIPARPITINNIFFLKNHLANAAILY